MCWFGKKKKEKQKNNPVKEEISENVTSEKNLKNDNNSVVNKESVENVNDEICVTECDNNEDDIVTEVQEKTKKAVYRVAFDKEDKLWKIRKDGAKRVICSFATKMEAIARVRELCETQELNFTVKKKNGKFQKKANLKK